MGLGLHFKCAREHITSEAAFVELRQPPFQPPAEPTKVSDDLAEVNLTEPKAADLDEFEIRRREFLGL